MELDKNKTKQLLEKAKVFTSEMLQTHDTKQEQSNCSGQLIPDSMLVRFSAFAGGTPLLN